MGSVVVYILYCADHTFHIGSTTNLNQRIAYHEKGLHQLTANRLPVRLHYSYQFSKVTEALAFEQRLFERSKKELATIHQANWVKQDIKTIENSLQTAQISTQKTNAVTLPTTYFGTISYFKRLLFATVIYIDGKEIFQKQSYRNRATILAANGLQNLIVPVERPNGRVSKTEEIRINYAENWQKNHVKTVESAYRKTPFYEFYAEELFSILLQQHTKLIDLNLALLRFFCSKLSLQCTFKLAESSTPINPTIANEMLPKQRNSFPTHEYTQAFDKTGQFESNLAIVDLLFNEGPNAIEIIKKSGGISPTF